MTKIQIDPQANRKAPKWSLKAKFGRILWALALPLFRYSPRPLWAWRRMLLRLFGAHIGTQVHVYPTVRITIPWNLTIGDHAAVGDQAILYALGPIEIGARATVSQYAHLCAGSHDWRETDMPLVKAPLVVGEDAWICADAFVGPGVRIGEGAILGARSVAMRDLEAMSIFGGNPAKKLKTR